MDAVKWDLKAIEHEITWTKEPVIGIVLLSAQHDSQKSPIEAMRFYEVGKHKPTGMLIILPAERREETLEEYRARMAEELGTVDQTRIALRDQLAGT